MTTDDTKNKLIISGVSIAAVAGAYFLYRTLTKPKGRPLEIRSSSPRPELHPASNKQSTLGTLKDDLQKSDQIKNANFPKTDEGRTYHVGTKSGEVFINKALTQLLIRSHIE
jgi:hypothetical protein